MRDLRGREMSMIFQNPRAALNPIRKIGRQIEDVLLQHAQVDSDAVAERAIEVLDQVRIARPRERYHAYPFELSGGMCQRVVIALALACRPQLLIADEPTTGLDVTTQKAVMDLIVELTRERGMSTILITHDLGLAAAYCDSVTVMEKGRVVETAKSQTIFKAPAHAYTRKLMRATPRPGVSLRDLLPREGGRPRASQAQDGGPGAVRRRAAAAGGEADQGISAQRVRRRLRQDVRAASRRSKPRQFPRRRRHQLFRGARRERRPGRRIRLRQVDHLDDGDAADRQDLGPDRIRRRGHRRNPGAASSPRLPLRKRIQMVFQDPTDSLNPRFTAARAIADPILRLGAADAPRLRCASVASSWPGRSACRSTCSTASRISFPAARRRASALPAPSRSSPT